MHFPSTFVQALTLLSLTVATSAAPAPQPATSTVAPPSKYKLQTKVVGKHKDCGSDKDGLWLYSYHTGAGLGDAALSSNKTWGWEGYLNKTSTEQVFETNIGPWPLAVTYGPYQVYSLVTISIASEDGVEAGFFFNQTGLQFNGSYGGWLACDWWHNAAPQLFNINGYTDGKVPNTCSHVQLMPIAV